MFQVMLMAARLERAKQERDYDTAIPLEKRVIELALKLEQEFDCHPWLTIVKGRNAYRKAKGQELLNA